MARLCSVVYGTRGDGGDDGIMGMGGNAKWPSPSIASQRVTCTVTVDGGGGDSAGRVSSGAGLTDTGKSSTSTVVAGTSSTEVAFVTAAHALDSANDGDVARGTAAGM